MIERADMLELTRRMTLSRSSIDRIAGAYMDREGFVDGSFNVHFLKLEAGEREKKLALAKAIPFAAANTQLKDYEFPKESRRTGSMWQLLTAMKECGLKNDALMETFYELVGEYYRSRQDYAILVFHDRYDVPAKGADKAWQWESEEVFEYLICAICPLVGPYEPGPPEAGFLFPAFANRSAYPDHLNLYQKGGDEAHPELAEEILGCRRA